MVRATVLALVTIATAGPMCSALEAQAEGAEAVAIVVHPQVPIDGLTLNELRSIFLAERQHLGGSLTDHPPCESRERA